jgi:hypothetical protein
MPWSSPKLNQRPPSAWSPEREGVHLGAGIEEGDLEAALGDVFGLPDQLMQRLLLEGAATVAVHVASVRASGRLPVDEDVRPYGARFVGSGRSG